MVHRGRKTLACEHSHFTLTFLLSVTYFSLVQESHVIGLDMKDIQPKLEDLVDTPYACITTRVKWVHANLCVRRQLIWCIPASFPANIGFFVFTCQLGPVTVCVKSL
jgi:hypothetical protein